MHNNIVFRLALALTSCLLAFVDSSQLTVSDKGTESSNLSPKNDQVVSLQKQRRFLGNLKKKVKKFKGKWKMSKKEVKKLFQVYYECIGTKVKEMEKEEFPIKAILALEGERIVMKCHVCYRPDQPLADQEAQWQFLRHEDTGLMPIREDKNHKIKKDNSLTIKAVDIEDAGQYFCLEKHDYAAVYQLDVFLKDKRKYVSMGKDRLMNDSVLPGRNLHVFSMWAEWGQCNTCGREGQMKRIGQCTVKKIKADQPIVPRDYLLMALYPEGIPCHSTALPKFLRHIPFIGSRHSETLVKSCMEECPTEPPQITVTDETGKVIDVLEPGFYPMDAKPAIKPFVKRKVLYEPEGSHLVLNCPTANSKFYYSLDDNKRENTDLVEVLPKSDIMNPRSTKSPLLKFLILCVLTMNRDKKPGLIRWMRGERDVDPSTVHRQTQGRVTVDSLNRLHLNPLLMSDTAVFNCWVKTRRVASIKVLVVEMANQEIKMYISYAGLVITLVGSFLFFCCICCKKSDKSAR